MGAGRSIARIIAGRVIGGGIAFAAVHAAVFWLAYFKCGGAHNSIKGIWQGLTTAGSIWADLVRWLGFPLSGISCSGVAFVLLMVVNSLLWGAVVGILVGLLPFRKH